jgi:hypothetical protein
LNTFVQKVAEVFVKFLKSFQSVLQRHNLWIFTYKIDTGDINLLLSCNIPKISLLSAANCVSIKYPGTM